jgi:hypothetical protein
MRVQACQDLSLANVVTNINQHLSDYPRENDTDMIRLLFIDGQTTDCCGCKRKRPRNDFYKGEARSLLRVLPDNSDVGRKLRRARRTCRRLSITTPNRTQEQNGNNNRD